MSFEFEVMRIPEVILVKPTEFVDSRGFFLETYSKKEFLDYGIVGEFVLHSMSFSKKGVLRGLHFQKDPHSQAKLVSVVKGKVYDVVVDVRNNSETFGAYVSVELSEYNKHMLYVPKGFAHGFMALEDSLVEYRLDHPYSKDSESGIIWNDERIGINWPIKTPVLSKKDAEWGSL